MELLKVVFGVLTQTSPLSIVFTRPFVFEFLPIFGVLKIIEATYTMYNTRQG